MNLNLQKPIVFFDLETTGINTLADRIVEIAILKIHPDGEEEMECRRLNPEIAIPASASEVHGIYDDDVKDCPTFKQIAKHLYQFLEGCDIGGFNSNKFDIPLLAEEFLRADIDFEMRDRRFVDVQNIFHKMEPRTLSAAYRFYCKKELDGAHGAEADTRATFEILKAQLERYDTLENDIAFLSNFSALKRNVDFVGRIIYNDNDEEVFNFGKYKGVKVEDVLNRDMGYYSWIMNGDFSLYTKKVLMEIKLRKFGGKK
ncbi:MAG: 3'-5' exonuclease [Cytophagaceae bacterium]|jgi:DNA polymerase-3 subunit epsilon|nr:3'-5' exonuclease [Cytophagaceae bacterium]